LSKAYGAYESAPAVEGQYLVVFSAREVDKAAAGKGSHEVIGLIGQEDDVVVSAHGPQFHMPGLLLAEHNDTVAAGVEYRTELPVR
jgi:hypothetical protein